MMAALMAMQVVPRTRLTEDISNDHDLIVLLTRKGSISVKTSIETVFGVESPRPTTEDHARLRW